MIILITVLAALSAFLLGFLFGITKKTDTQTIKKTNLFDDEDLQRIKREYENFLNYDGSVQN